MSKFTFAVLADLHLTKLQGTSQYAVFHWAIQAVNADKPDFAVVAGDITAYGDREAFSFFEEKIKSVQIPYRVVMGNADLRTAENISQALILCRKDVLEYEGRRIVCIDTSDTHIHEADKSEILKCSHNDILIMHHSIDALDEESQVFLSRWAEKNRALIIHGHNHRNRDYMIGQTRCIGIRCLDPDKAIGKEPCLVYVTVDENQLHLEEKCFSFPHYNVKDFREYLGISCFDIYHDIDFAVDTNLKNIEIRKYTGSGEELEFLKEKVYQWRMMGGKNVSVHMPNLRWNGTEVEGITEWNAALRIVQEVQAQNVTIHPPRYVRIRDMSAGSETWNKLVYYFGERIDELPLYTKVGIENIHSESWEFDDEERCFGYKPEEILSFVEALNVPYGYERVGVVLDIGHARNNGPHFSQNVLSSWYKQVGNKTTAYHIHQVTPENGKLYNHTAITNWFGAPSLSFVSFIWAWQMNQLNHCPMFMEMKNKENCGISLNAFEAYANKYIDIE